MKRSLIGAVLAAAMAVSACVGYGYGGSVGYAGPAYDGGFYEPYGYDYGGWGGGYRVGPPRGDWHGRGGDGHGPGGGDHGHGGGAPSIPHGPRGGGGPAGGHGGGGHPH